MWKNFIPEKYHEMVVAQFPAFQTVTGEICPPPDEGWEIFPTEHSFYGSGPNQTVNITPDALHIWGDIRDYGDYRVTAIIVYTDNRLEINYRDDIEQRTVRSSHQWKVVFPPV